MTYQYTVAPGEQCDVAADEGPLGELLAVFRRACERLDLDAYDGPRARLVARAVIEAGLAGEDDPERLFEHAVQAARAS